MVVHIPRLLRRSPRSFFSVLGVFVIIAGADPSLLSQHSDPQPVASVRPVTEFSVLSGDDKQHYLDALHFQQAKQYEAADQALVQVSDPILKADLLLARYQSADYVVSEQELRDWLKDNAGHPRAAALYSLAQKLHIELPAIAGAHEAEAAENIVSSGYDRSILRSGTHGQWNAGLSAYRKQDMAGALAHFTALLADGSNLADYDRAAVAFWAYRAAAALGNKAQAQVFAEQAASQAPGFYSILARRVLAQLSQQQDAQAKLETMADLFLQPAVRHAIALKEIGQDEYAQQELRGLFAARTKDSERKQLMELAELLNLPAAKMHMALDYNQNEGQAHDLQYPMPHWTPTSGYKIEPALLYAIMRQESGFNPNAHSASGAIGVMQLMPETAYAMARSERIAGPSRAPAVSMALGQGYLERLMQTPAIGDNLIYLTAAYNAGPGTLASWQRTMASGADPLLFIESIPYEETREYVVHVMGNYWIYADLFGGHEMDSAATLAQGKWPRYAGLQQLTSMLNHAGSSTMQ